MTEQSEEKYKPLYLYQDEEGKWWVGKTPGEERGLLRSNPSKTLPTAGWSYDHNGAFHEDSSLVVATGPLPHLPRYFTVTVRGAAVEKWPSYQGVYTKTQRWWRGRPVYVSTEGRLLHHGGGDDGWMIGPTLGKRALSGSRARHSPGSENSWRYWTGGEWKPASVTVTGSE